MVYSLLLKLFSGCYFGSMCISLLVWRVVWVLKLGSNVMFSLVIVVLCSVLLLFMVRGLVMGMVMGFVLFDVLDVGWKFYIGDLLWCR